MPLNNQQVNELRSLGFKYRNKNRYCLNTKQGQFFALNIIDESFWFEVDGTLVKSKLLSFEEAVRVIKTLYPNE